MSVGSANTISVLPAPLTQTILGPATPAVNSESQDSSSTTDSVEISPAAQKMSIVVEKTVEAEAISILPRFPFPGSSSIDRLQFNLRQQENLEGQLFRLQDQAREDRQLGELASEGVGPIELKNQANKLRKDGKFEEAQKLDEQFWQMQRRSIPQDDPSTPENELKDAGQRLLQRADNKKLVASVITQKLDKLEEDFLKLIENVSLDEPDFSPPFFIAEIA